MLTPMAALLVVALQAAPSVHRCRAGELRLVYDYGFNDQRTGCFKARGRTGQGKRQGQWTFVGTVGDHPSADPLTVVGHYHHGKRHGRWITSVKKEDGGCEVKEYKIWKAAEGNYRGGKRHGRWSYAVRDDQAKGYHRATYLRGALQGPAQLVCDRGQGWTETGSFSKGKRSGSWSRIRCDGKRKEWGKYKKGKRHGIWFRWAQNRRYDLRCRYRAGRQIGRCGIIKDAGLRRVFKGYRGPFRRGGPLGPPR